MTNSRCKRFRLWHQILELSTGTTLSWLMSYSFYFHILELECTVIILKFIILLLKLWTFAASFQLPSPSLILFTLDYFQWYGSRFPCSGEKKPKAGATVLSFVQGILFGKLFSLAPCNYFYIRVSLDLGKGRHNSIISREGLILGTYILKFLH